MNRYRKKRTAVTAAAIACAALCVVGSTGASTGNPINDEEIVPIDGSDAPQGQRPAVTPTGMTCEPAACPPDFDGGREVDFDDLLHLLVAWGLCADCQDCPEDLNNDCEIGFDDLLILLAWWGRCPGQPDLVIPDIDVQSSVVQGCTLHVRYRIENVGDVVVEEDIVLEVYVSLDEELDESDTLIGTRMLHFSESPLGLCDPREDEFDTNAVGVPTGDYHLILLADAADAVEEWDEDNNEFTQPLAVQRLDVAIGPIDVEAVVEGERSEVRVTLTNDSCSDVIVRLHGEVVDRGGGDEAVCEVPARGETICSVWLLAPDVPWSCGDTTRFDARVWIEVEDQDLDNNERVTDLLVLPEYVDLRLEIVDEPSAALLHPCNCPPGKVSWKVRVWNVGTVDYLGDGACFMTGIVQYSGPGRWSCPDSCPLDGIRFIELDDPIEDGGYRTYTVNNYRILCGAWPLRQYIKAEINYEPGDCDDACGRGAGNNYAHESIRFIPVNYCP